MAKSWGQSARVFCGSGTAAFCSQTGQIRVGPTLSGAPIRASIDTPIKLYPVLKELGILPLCTQYVPDNAPRNYLIPIYWNLVPIPEVTAKISDRAVRKLWSGIRVAFARRNNLVGVVLAGQIADQIDLCILGLHEISRSYNWFVNTELSGPGVWNNGPVESVNSVKIYLAVSSTLVALVTLRDFIAKFAAEYGYGFDSDKVDDYKKLREQIDGKTDSLSEHFKRCDDWLADVGSVRNLLVHWTTLANAQGSKFVEKTSLQVKDDELPQIWFRFPAKPASHRKLKKFVSQFASYAEFQRYYLNDEELGPDALAYCHASLIAMLELSTKAAHFSPVQPEVKAITV